MEINELDVLAFGMAAEFLFLFFSRSVLVTYFCFFLQVNIV